jgi:hypothetical protein
VRVKKYLSVAALCLAVGIAQLPASLADDAANPGLKAKVQQDAKAVSQAVKSGATKAGASIKRGARKTGDAIKRTTHKVGDAAKRATKKSPAADDQAAGEAGTAAKPNPP